MKEMVCFALAAGVGRDAVENTPPRPWVFLALAALSGLVVLARALGGLRERCGPRRPLRCRRTFPARRRAFSWTARPTTGTCCR